MENQGQVSSLHGLEDPQRLSGIKKENKQLNCNQNEEEAFEQDSDAAFH